MSSGISITTSAMRIIQAYAMSAVVTCSAPSIFEGATTGSGELRSTTKIPDVGKCCHDSDSSSTSSGDEILNMRTPGMSDTTSKKNCHSNNSRSQDLQDFLDMCNHPKSSLSELKTRKKPIISKKPKTSRKHKRHKKKKPNKSQKEHVKSEENDIASIGVFTLI